MQYKCAYAITRIIPNHSPDDKILPLFELKAFAEENSNLTQMVQFFCDRVENVKGKVETLVT